MGNSNTTAIPPYKNGRMVIRRATLMDHGTDDIDDLEKPSMTPPEFIKRYGVRIPLKERDRFTVDRMWHSCSRDMTNAGVVMFTKLFEDHADIKKMFEQFRSVDTTELWVNDQLENHALLVMNAIDEAFTTLEDEFEAINLLLVMGKSHRRFDNFQGCSFWVTQCCHNTMPAIEKPFIHGLIRTLPSANQHIITLFQKTIHFILQVLVIGHDTSESVRGIELISIDDIEK